MTDQGLAGLKSGDLIFTKLWGQSRETYLGWKSFLGLAAVNIRLIIPMFEKEWKGSGWRKPGAAEKGYSAGAVAWGTGMQSLPSLHTAGSKSEI